MHPVCGIVQIYLCGINTKAERGAACLRHPGSTSCKLPSPQTVDILVAGGPTEPFAKKAPTRKKNDTVAYDVTFGDGSSIMSLTAQLLPSLLILEQVPEFATGFGRDGVRHLEKLENIILGIKGADGSPHFSGVSSVPLDAKVWVDCPRDRSCIIV